MKTRHLEADQWLNKNGVWVLEDGDSCHKTGKIDICNVSFVSHLPICAEASRVKINSFKEFVDSEPNHLGTSEINERSL